MASAAHARGAVSLAQGDAPAALRSLLEARRCWNDVGAPYDGARARVLLGEAYRALGDARSALAELEAARATFVELGAALDAATVGAILDPALRPDGLTAREVEVLREVAAGRTNRDVARALFISEKTVARHLSNLFVKIGVTSRTEAAAYAFAHGLADPAEHRSRG